MEEEYYFCEVCGYDMPELNEGYLTASRTLHFKEDGTCICSVCLAKEKKNARSE